MNAILKALSDFGDAAGWLVAAIVFAVYARRIVRENDRAHETLQNAIIEFRDQLAELRDHMHKIATDVAVLRDRSDRNTPEPDS